MRLITKEIIQEVGNQLVPIPCTMGSSTQSHFKQIINDMMQKELTAVKLEAVTAEMLVIGRILKEEISSSTQYKLLKRFHKLGKDLDKIE